MVDQRSVWIRLPSLQRLLQSVELRKSVRMELLTRQPTMRLANTSMTKATYSQPCQLET